MHKPMDIEPPKSKAKLIAWCVAIAAVVVMYVVFSGHKSSTALTPTTTMMSTPAPTNTQSSSASTGSGSTSSYKDGSYTTSSSYRVPHGSETMQVTLTVSGGTVTGATLNQNPDNGTSAEYQSAFQDSYKQYVVGQKLSSLNVPNVSGASLTTMAFDQALEQIKSQAQA